MCRGWVLRMRPRTLLANSVTRVLDGMSSWSVSIFIFLFPFLLSSLLFSFCLLLHQPWDLTVLRLYQSTLPDKAGLKVLAESYFKHIHCLRNLGFIHKPAFIRSIDQGTTALEFGEAVLYLVCALGARYLCVLFSPRLLPL